MTRSAIVFFPSTQLEATPPVYNLARCLAASGWDVRLITESMGDSVPEVQVIGPENPWPSEKGIRPILAGRKRLRRQLRDRPDLLILCGWKGLLAGSSLNTQGIQNVYLSLELYQTEDLHGFARLYKPLERFSLRTIDLVVIQDDHRADLFADDTGYSRRRIVSLPNTFLDSDGESGETVRDLFSLHNKIIVIYAGSIAPWAKLLELVKSTRNWPKEWILVVHSSRPPVGENRSYAAEVRAAAPSERVLFSTHPVKPAHLRGFLSGADVGVAFYDAEDLNIRHVGLGAGKVAAYLQAGLPVIVNMVPHLSEYISSNDLGLSVEDFPEIPEAVTFLMAEPKRRARIREWFREHLSFESHFEKLDGRLRMEVDVRDAEKE